MLPTWTRGWRPPALSTTLHRKSFASCRGSPWWPRPTPASGDGLVPARAETPLDMRLDLRAEPAEADPVLGEQVQVVGGVGQMHGAAGGWRWTRWSSGRASTPGRRPPGERTGRAVLEAEDAVHSGVLQFLRTPGGIDDRIGQHHVNLQRRHGRRCSLGARRPAGGLILTGPGTGSVAGGSLKRGDGNP